LWDKRGHFRFIFLLRAGEMRQARIRLPLERRAGHDSVEDTLASQWCQSASVLSRKYLKKILLSSGALRALGFRQKTADAKSAKAQGYIAFFILQALCQGLKP
jgi:hypothetical protein